MATTRSARAGRTDRRPRRGALALTAVVVIASGFALAPTPAFAEQPYAALDRTPIAFTPAPAGATPTVAANADDGGATAPAPGSVSGDRLTTQATGVEPFDLIGVTASTESPEGAFIRLHKPDGWGEWETLQLHSDSGPTPGSDEEARSLEVTGGKPVSEPIWVGDADGYELNVPGDARDAEVLLVREKTGLAPVPDAESSGVPIQGHPDINLRAAWGARAPKVPPIVAPTVRFMVIHHSVSANFYTPDEVPGILRSIQAFHMDGNGWDDIGYNFAVDRWGGRWEARSGGMDRAVIGAHSFDQNYESSAIVGLGDFSVAPPTNEMVDAWGEIAGWKLELHGWDVDNWWDGRPSIVGHRDVNQTECPGQYAYDRLGSIRALAKAKQDSMRAASGFWTDITLATNPDGRLEAFATRNSNEIWHNWQRPGSGTWSGWAPLMGNATGRPTVVNNADKRLEVFAISGTGELVHMWQIPNVGWSAAASLGGSNSPSAGVAVGLNGDGGRLEAFVLNDNDVVYHIWQWPTSPNGWSGYAALGDGFPSNANLEVVNNADKRLEVFATDDDGTLSHAFQQPGTASGFSPFLSLGMPSGGGASAARNKDGRLEVFAVADDGGLWHAWQSHANGSFDWSGPALIGAFQARSAVELMSDQNGQLQLFGLAPDGQVWSMWQTPLTPTGWNGMQYFYGATVFGKVDVAKRSDNRLMVAGIMRPGGQQAVMSTQNTPNGTWSTMTAF